MAAQASANPRLTIRSSWISMPCSRSRHRARKPTLRKSEDRRQIIAPETFDIVSKVPPGNRVAATPPFCDRNVHEAGRAARSEAGPLQLEPPMKSESAKRNVVSENDAAIRNPFGVMDVPHPNDDDVTQFARNTMPEDSAADENAKSWSA